MNHTLTQFRNDYQTEFVNYLLMIDFLLNKNYRLHWNSNTRYIFSIL